MHTFRSQFILCSKTLSKLNRKKREKRKCGGRNEARIVIALVPFKSQNLGTHCLQAFKTYRPFLQRPSQKNNCTHSEGISLRQYSLQGYSLNTLTLTYPPPYIPTPHSLSCFLVEFSINPAPFHSSRINPWAYPTSSNPGSYCTRPSEPWVYGCFVPSCAGPFSHVNSTTTGPAKGSLGKFKGRSVLFQRR